MALHQGQHRLRYLDGLRGVAASSVVIWHYLGPTYADHLPFGCRYCSLPVAGDGWVGVPMFFLISGFVIFMTIERCRGFVDFMTRRFVRLYPALLIASLLLLAIFTSWSLPGDAATARPLNLLPGLIFVSPAVLHALVHRDIPFLDPVFWTLAVEMVFYVVFGCLYFAWGWKRAVASLIVMVIAVRSLRMALPFLSLPPMMGRLIEPFEWLGIDNFGWFAAGALFYKAYTKADRRLYWLAVAVSLFAVLMFHLSVGMTPRIYVALLVVVLLFSAAQRLAPLQRLLTVRPLLFLGFISYPLYLVHNNLGVGLIALLGPRLAPAPSEWAVPVVAVPIVLFAWLIARYGEPPLARLFRSGVDRIRARGAR